MDKENLEISIETEIGKPKNSIIEIASLEEVNKELRNIFNDNDKLSKLLYNALKKIRFYFNNDIIDGFTAEDIVQEITEKFITGKKKWYKTEGRTLENLLFMGIHSYVKTIYFNRHKKQFEEDNERIKEGLEISPFIKTNRAKVISFDDLDNKTRERSLNANENYWQKFEDNEENDFIISTEHEIELLLNELKNDDIAYIVFEEYLGQGNSDIKVANSLQMEIEEVRNVKKRIRRAAGKVKKREDVKRKDVKT